MDTVKWAHSSAMEADDILVSDNLLEFVKDEDIALDNPDEIFPQDIFNEIINKFDFNDNDVNINSFLDELTTPNTNQYTHNDILAKAVADPLLSSSNASINYNNFQPITITVPTQNKVTIPLASIADANAAVSIETPTAIPSAEIPDQLETVVYHIADKSIAASSFVTTASQIPSQPTTTAVLSNLTPIQMVFNNADTDNFQPVQQYCEVSESPKASIVRQSGLLLKPNSKVVETSSAKPIILNPTVVYAASTPISSTSIQLINTTNGTILATQVPFVVEQEQSNPPKVKEVKKTTHNAIERRYRTSINDKIVELKNMLVGDSGKLNKSAILKRSIEKIHDLESENYELKLQNARLREMLLAQGPMATEDSSLKTLLLQKAVNPHKRRYTHSSSAGSEYGSNASPPTSDESNPSLSPAHSDNGSMPPSPLASDEISTDIDRSAKRNKKVRTDNITTHGMSSMSKLTLCAFMFAIITINPFASLFSDSPANRANILVESMPMTSRRTILNVDIESLNIFQTIWQRFSHSLIALILNGIILTVCLVKLCFHSDPVMNFHSPVAEKYFKQKQIADAEFDRGNASAAFIAYEKCLQMFGISLPQSWFELIPMTIWQFLRCCAHRLRFGPWLSRKFGRIICSDETQENALNSAQELAVILNRCNLIHLSQNVSDGCGLILSMYAVNMAEVARNIAPLTLIDVYLTAALRCKKNYVYCFSWICSRYYMSKARSEATMLCGRKLPAKYNWIFAGLTDSVYGYKFMCKFSFDEICSNTMATSLFNAPVNPLDTLSLVFASYNQHLLKSALQCLVGVSYTSNNDIKSLDCNNATVIRDVLNYSQLLKENNNDPLVFWWSCLFSIDAFWLLGDDEAADKMFEDVRKIPRALRESKDPLARAAVTVFCAKKLLAMKQPNRIEKIWSLCNCASKLFSESLVYNKNVKSDMIGFVQLLICDWLMETRTACWEMKQARECADVDNNNHAHNNPLPGKELEQFQNDLNSLYCIVDRIPAAKSRVYLYEAMSRLMAGAAPGYTQALLDRSLYERRNNNRSALCGHKDNQNSDVNDKTASRRRCGQNFTINVEGERERAAAIYVACKYLPTPFICLPERMGMLAMAVKTLKKVGNQKKLNDCYELMQSFRTTTAPTN